MVFPSSFSFDRRVGSTSSSASSNTDHSPIDPVGGELCRTLDNIPLPTPQEPVLNLRPHAPGAAGQVEAALTLLRRRTGVPLAERVGTGLPTDRAAAIALLDRLLADGEPPGPLAPTGELAAAAPGRTAIALAASLRDRLKAPASADPAALTQEVEELIGVLDAIPSVRTQPAQREHANAALRAIVGGQQWDLVAMLNSDREVDRTTAAKEVDTLLSYLKVLTTPAPGASHAEALPPPLRAALDRFAFEAGHCLSAGQRDELRQLPGVGADLQPLLQASAGMAGCAQQTLARLCQRAGASTGSSGAPADAKALAELTALGASARAVADCAPAVMADAHHAGGRLTVSARDHWRGSMLHAALAPLIQATEQEQFARLHRWLTTPAMVALRALAHRTLRTSERDDEGNSRAASAKAQQRRELGDWLAAYDELTALLAMRMGLQAGAQARPKDGKGDKAGKGGKRTEASAAQSPGSTASAGTAPSSSQDPAAAPGSSPAQAAADRAGHGEEAASPAPPAPPDPAIVVAAAALFRAVFGTEPPPQPGPEATAQSDPDTAPRSTVDTPANWVRA